MSEQVSLEVPATLSALSAVRMVLGGLGARLDFSLEDLDDLFLATDHLFEAALDAEELDKLTVNVTVSEGSLRVVAGDFRTDGLRAQVGVTPGGCIDLCTLLHGLLDGVTLEEDTDSFSVVMVKHGPGGGA